jgi:hypothetical protein
MFFCGCATLESTVQLKDARGVVEGSGHDRVQLDGQRLTACSRKRRGAYHPFVLGEAIPSLRREPAPRNDAEPSIASPNLPGLAKTHQSAALRLATTHSLDA